MTDQVSVASRTASASPASDVTPHPRSVEFWASHVPELYALKESLRALTWSEWNERADRLAEVLHSQGGVGEGDFVALCMQNRLEWFITQAAATKLGAVLVPLSWRLTPREIQYIVADCGARAFAFDDENPAELVRAFRDQNAAERRADVQLLLSVSPIAQTQDFSAACQDGKLVRRYARHAPRALVYTSGTTGRPRGVVRAQPPKPDGARPRIAASATPSPVRNLLGAPLNHAAGQASARGTLAVGGCVYVMPRFDPREALGIIEREKITMTFLVPTMLNRIMSLPEELRAAHDVSSIQLIVTGASPCPQSLKEKVIGYFGDRCLIESYGSTEVGLVARMLPDDHLRKPGSCGRIIDGVELRIVGTDGSAAARGELGEIMVKTPMMIERYLNEPSPSDMVDGFFATGDVGRIDDDGYLYIVDRKRDMIIAGGVNIYPAEIEHALMRHAAVFDAAVFGIPHPDLGEEVRAVVECVEGQSVSEPELLAFIADSLASYKRPRRIEFVAEIPRNAAGKILKAQLREPFWVGTGKTI